MAEKIPIKALYNGSDSCALAEYQAADFIGLVNGGTGQTSAGIDTFVQPGCFGFDCGTTFLGICAGSSTLEAGKFNTMIGYRAGMGVSSSCSLVLIGMDAGKTITTGAESTIAIGQNAGCVISTGINNTLVGTNTGRSLTTESNNTFIGLQAGYSATSSDNTAVGSNALFSLTTGTDTVAIGTDAGRTVCINSDNVFIGKHAGCVSVCGNNTIIGSKAGLIQSVGTDNTMVGVCTGLALTIGNNNTLIGSRSGRALIGGTNNIFIGSGAGCLVTQGVDNVIIGNCVKATTTTNCSFIVGNGDTTLIFGCLADCSLSFNNGNTSSPNEFFFNDGRIRVTAVCSDNPQAIRASNYWTINYASGLLSCRAQLVVDAGHGGTGGGSGLNACEWVAIGFGGVYSCLAAGTSGGFNGPKIAAQFRKINQTQSTPDRAGDFVFINYNEDDSHFESMRIDYCGLVGIGTNTPTGTLHIHSGSAGAVTACNTADDLVIESAGDGGLSILTPAACNARIYFGSPTNPAYGQIDYDHSTNDMVFATSGTGKLLINAGGCVGFGLSPTELLDMNGGNNRNIRIGAWSFIGSGYSGSATIIGFNSKVDTTSNVTNQVQTVETPLGAESTPAFVKLYCGQFEIHSTRGSATFTGCTLDCMTAKFDRFGNMIYCGICSNGISLMYCNDITNNTATAGGLNFYQLCDLDRTISTINFHNSTGFLTARIGAQYEDAGDRNTDIYFATRANSQALTEVMRITNAGRVGIGTYVPKSKLHVCSSTTDNIFTLQGIAQYNYDIRQLGVAGWHFDHCIGSGNATFSWTDGAGTEMMRINPTGIGIGTNSPTSKLSVVDTAAPIISIRRSVAGISEGTDMGYIHFGDVACGKANAYIRASGGGTWGTANLPTRLTFATTSPSTCDAVERLTIDDNGNIGIGTTTPLEKLHITGAAGARLLITNAGSAGNINSIGFDSTNLGYRLGATISYFDNSTTGTCLLPYSMNLLVNHCSNAIQFGRLLGNCSLQANDFCRWAIIGGDNSDHCFIVSPDNNNGFSQPKTGCILINSVNASTGINGLIAFRSSCIMSTRDGVDGNGGLEFVVKCTSAIKAMTIDSSGKVGIGSAAPDTKLRIQYSQNGSSEGLKLDSATRTDTEDGLSAIEVIGNSNYGTIFNLQMNGQIQISPLGTERFTIDSSGNVGIGTSSPTGLLNLMADGATPFAGATPVLLDIKRGVTNISANNNTAIRLGNNSNGFQISYGGSADHLQFIDGGANAAVTILNGGNVGIGTSSPSLQTWRTNTYLTIDNGTDGGVVELVTSASDASGNEAGAILWGATGNTTNHKHIGGIEMVTEGSTATQRGAYMRLLTKADGTAQPTERLRILKDGGITFNGDTAAANALDDYEEGTWVPCYLGSTTSPTVTYETRCGHYTKIGNIVWLSGYLLVFQNCLTGGSGTLQIGGLPYSVATSSAAAYQFLWGGYNQVNGVVCGNDYRLQANNAVKLDTYGVNSSPTWSSAAGIWEHSFIGVLKIA